jgi:hypothetical protein
LNAHCACRFSLETHPNNLEIHIIHANELDLEGGQLTPLTASFYVRAVPKRLKSRDLPPQRFKPFGALKFDQPPEEDPRLPVAFQRICVMHPPLAQILQILFSQVCSRPPVSQQVRVNGGRDSL